MRCITFVCLIAALSASAAFAEISSERVAVPAHPVPEARLFYDAPAQVWTEALPLGNGRLGAMVYGGITKELLPINEDTIWSGGPGANITGGLSPETFAKAREQIFAGDYAAVKNTLPKGYRGAAAYEYFGKLEIDFGGDGDAEAYTRTLSLDDAVARVTYVRGGVTYVREAFASFTDDVVVLRVTASRPGAVSFDARILPPWDGRAVVSEGDRIVYRDKTEGAGKLHFEGIVAAQTTGGELVSKDGVLSVRGADAATLYVSVATNFKNFRDVSGDEHARAVEKLETAIKVPYETAKAAHSAFYREQADRCTLWLGRDPQPGVTTFRRLATFPETNDPSLVASRSSTAAIGRRAGRWAGASAFGRGFSTATVPTDFSATSSRSLARRGRTTARRVPAEPTRTSLTRILRFRSTAISAARPASLRCFFRATSARRTARSSCASCLRCLTPGRKGV